ncbi:MULTISPECIES: adenylate/guanylate cyclase domain-containing protein [unclassified Bradyrhizobium]|uniref:adenylate/guanylate cyclase domain-containing protein n=1 Tax=unclassified Bradyrhizobium TaxID=2631580 RepID=UPI001BABA79D|nr:MULTISPECIES: adenylate/guanylate cyclase domain-containing protein [unclassified Bradyrhizobium]MBR1207792.1 adenylate/guanylate cyclase domain-containing protein [Bradyrhizobium sp. AUGA SZCCT0124]MBR1316331.1 adenylate/guanylate cyclase domain-containing protein [Bradyrhizobium sp. AUGA SZCCT0051]MBR1344342.1 adenylate/guanylate cyclase domain-containing protein [Bradyrhizobium sp. AUGA SZCCT0105]MBR1359353.1 adenylate/guanylate cyclase domain-containing protein [Bradyrhizobium sp. AUGA S
MKRKIAAIFAADIAGYSRLVAEDEEETLRRLASYRQVTDDFIAKCGGRIFNTAGDAVLAEFPSAVEAVRCAIDIQESLRTRNMAYPPSRQMSFRIGITIGDVVERDGDLLGDGVNIAARLEGLAEVGGICVSRAVHEQVANKLSVQFADIGAQEVKNIPTPVHAYMVAMRREDGTYATPQLKKPIKAAAAGAPAWMWPTAITVVLLAAIGVGGFLYYTKLETSATKPAAVASSPPAPTPLVSASPAPLVASSPPASSVPSAKPAPPVPAAPASSLPPPIASGDKLATDIVPFVSDRTRIALATEYLPAGNSKAIALNINGFVGWSVAQPSEDAAKTAALDLCQKRADNAGSPRKCELYAVGNAIVYAHGQPPVPPLPWVKRDALVEKPYATKDVPLLREAARTRLDSLFVPGRKTRTIALGPGGHYFFNSGIDSLEESARRNLQACGAVAGVPCTIVVVDDAFVVPIPATLRVTGFFKPADSSVITPGERSDVARKLTEATAGWNAVAVGTQGRPGLGLKAENEQSAVNAALGDCARRDSDCHVIAVGPFTVGPN